MQFLQVELPEGDIDVEMLGHALERRLQARAARADSGVTITPELVSDWAREELSALVAEIRELRLQSATRVLS